MFKFILFVLWLSSSNARECGISGSSNYVVGGKDANFLEFPWQISLRFQEKGAFRHTCGGSIINEQWILTAAHCVARNFVYAVVTGEHNEALLQNPVRDFHQISKIVIHPKYNNETIDYDFALIRLQFPLQFNGKHSYLTTICLPQNGDSFEGVTCAASGWGLNKHLDPHEAPLRKPTLQKVELRVLSHDACESLYNRINRITPRMVCARNPVGYIDGKGVCSGDSGGPLQCMRGGRYYLTGVASYVVRCGSGRYPSVFARVSAVTEWILNTAR